MPIINLLNSSFVSWMDGKGPESDIVITSRVRLARNLAMVPFPHMLKDEQQARQVIEQLKQSLPKLPGYDMTRLDQLSELDRQVLVEKHLISPEFAREASPFKATITNDIGSVAIMVNEEDHLRIQCMLPGLQLGQAYGLADEVDNALESVLDYAFDEDRGYLTACPTNVGTGMRASVMLHLPAIAMTNQQGQVFGSVPQLGLTVRGLYGENTEFLGNFYQLSNQVTLGLSEEDIINNLWTVTMHVVEQERGIREKLRQDMPYQLEDKVWRSYGLVTHARVLSSQEALALLSDVRMGVDMGILPSIPRHILNELIVAIRPAHLQRSSGREMEPLERDVARAEIIKKKLKVKTK